MRTYFGQRGADGSTRVMVGIAGRIQPVVHNDPVHKIMLDVLGQRALDDDYTRYSHLRDQVLARLGQADGAFTDQDLRDWQLAYDAAAARESSPSSTEGSALTSEQEAQPARSEVAQALGQLVQVYWGESRALAKLLHASASILLLQGTFGLGARPAVGSLVTVRVPHQEEPLEGRLAGFGQNQVYLVALGTRGVRQAPRYKVHLPAVAHGRALPQPVRVIIADLSRSGARVRGLALRTAEEFDLTFYPPGKSKPTRIHAVVTHVAEGEPPELGVAFCLAALDFDERAIRTQERQALAA